MAPRTARVFDPRVREGDTIMPLHWYDLLVVFGIALLFFGPKRLPEMGSSIGKTIREFQKSMKEVTEPNNTPAVTPPPAPVQQIPAAPVAQVATVTPVEPPIVVQPPVASIEHSND